MLNYEFPPLGGGAGVTMLAILRKFAAISNVRIDVITSSVDRFEIVHLSNNIRLHKLSIGKKANWHHQTMWNLLVYSWKCYFYAKKLKRSNHYDLCHAFFGIPCGFIAKHLDLPYIVSLQGSDVPFHNKKFFLLDLFFFRRMSAAIWRGAGAVISLSNYLRKSALLTSPNQPIAIICNGVDMSMFSPSKRVKPSKPFTVLLVGRLAAIKGFTYALKAFSTIANTYPYAQICIVGDGPQRSDLEYTMRSLKLENRVYFLGRIEHSSLATVYQNSHVLVLSSINESLSNVVLEAMASGLPIICTKTGAAELIDKNGIVVSPGSAEEIASALSYLIEHPLERKQMGQRSRELALKYSWQEVAEQYREIYRQCALSTDIT